MNVNVNMDMDMDMDINEYVLDRRLIQGLQNKYHTFWGRGPTRAVRCWSLSYNVFA